MRRPGAEGAAALHAKLEVVARRARTSVRNSTVSGDITGACYTPDGSRSCRVPERMPYLWQPSVSTRN